MRNNSFSAIVFAGAFAVAVPVFAQDATTPAAEPEAPAASVATEAPATTVIVPDGFTVIEFGAVTAEQLQGVNLYDAAGDDIAEIADLVIGADNSVTGIVTDVGGFLGMGEHRVLLSPEQVQVYKNADEEVRGFVTLTKEEMEALPAYEAP